MREMSMFSIFSWMRQTKIDLVACVLVIGSCLATGAMAETESVRIGEHFMSSAPNSYQARKDISEIRDLLQSDMQQFSTGFGDCANIVSRDLNDGTPRDRLRATWTAMQSIKVYCWTAMQFEPDTPVIPTRPEDRLTPEIIHGIMAGAERLSQDDEDAAKTLVAFPAGMLSCKDKERCKLAAPDDGDWANYALYMDLVLVNGDDFFVTVSQAYRGQVGLVYGVHWRATGIEGKIVSIFAIFD
jgi:hypothetical protein